MMTHGQGTEIYPGDHRAYITCRHRANVQLDPARSQFGPKIIDGRIPIVLAVTGHRDSLNATTIAGTLKHELRNLKKNYPNSPFVALSPLAEGGDRLFAQAALDEGIDLIVPLPLPQADYEADFPESIDAFRHFLTMSSSVFILPYLTGNTPENTCEPGKHRDLQYAQAGFYIAQRAHVLFALWNGEETTLLGGTAQVVRFRNYGSVRQDIPLDVENVLADVLPPLSPLDAAEFGLICHIHAQRRTTPDAAVEKPTVWYPHEKRRQDDYREAIHQIDAYNKFIEAGSASLATSFAHGAQQPVEGVLYRQFFAADHLANAKIKRNRRIFGSIFVLAALQAASLEIYSEFWPHWPPLFFYLACLAVIVVLVDRLRRHETHQRAIDYRALAEGLRVQRFWRIAGLKHMVAHHYLRRHAGSLRWVRVALQGCVNEPRDAAADPDYVLKHWIEDQRAYFFRSRHRRLKLMDRLHSAASSVFRVGIAVAGMALILVWLGLMPAEASSSRKFLLLTMALLPTFAGLIAGYLESTAYREDVREHDRLHRLFEGAARQFAALPGSRRTLIEDLGKEALDESASWALLHKAHEPEIPSG